MDDRQHCAYWRSRRRYITFLLLCYYPPPPLTREGNSDTQTHAHANTRRPQVARWARALGNMTLDGSKQRVLGTLHGPPVAPRPETFPRPKLKRDWRAASMWTENPQPGGATIGTASYEKDTQGTAPGRQLGRQQAFAITITDTAWP